MKKIQGLLIVLCLASCGNVNNKVSAIKENKPKITYKYEKCKLCNGTGKVAQSVGEKSVMAVMTMGMSLLSNEYVDCPQCKGNGYVKVADKIK